MFEQTLNIIIFGPLFAWAIMDIWEKISHCAFKSDEFFRPLHLEQTYWSMVVHYCIVVVLQLRAAK